MDKLTVSYYLPETLVNKIDERGASSGNRSRQLCDDLLQFYDMLDFGLKAALRALDADELRTVIQAIQARALPSLPTLSASKPTLADVVTRFSPDTALANKIDAFDNLTCYALFDWALDNA